MGRAITRADFEKVFHTFAEVAVPAFDEHGVHPPMLFFVLLAETPGEIDSFDVLPENMSKSFFVDENSKNRLSHFLREMTTPGSSARKFWHERGFKMPDIIVQVNEAWVKATTGQTKEQARAMARDSKGLENLPGRTEAIIVMMHTTGLTAMGTCPIHDNPRRAVIGELMGEEWKGEGRLSMTKQEP